VAPEGPGKGNFPRVERCVEAERTAERIRDHYEIERELAKRLIASSREDRRRLYREVYDELFRRVPDHPMLTRKQSAEERARAVGVQMKFLGRFLRAESTFMEIGAGDCSLSFAACERVKQVFAIDVSDEITRAQATHAHFRLVLSDGCSIPLPAGSVDLAYSNQLMEHLHPDDAVEQLQNIRAALAPGGRYICITPNRFTGPHDVSRAFDSVATGFHLKEYTITELVDLFRRVGFVDLSAHVGARGRSMRFPISLLRAFERALGWLPGPLRRRVARTGLSRALLDVKLVATR